MIIDKKLLERFKSLIVLATDCKNTRNRGGGKHMYDPPYDYVDFEKSYKWGTSCLQLFRQVFEVESDYYSKFDELFDKFKHSSNYVAFSMAHGILNAAKDDYENGYLFKTRTLIEAEIFVDFLEQSEHLLRQGYFQASAVIAGSVLEDALRKLCIKNNITLSAKPKMDSMNSELAKANVYNLLKQKQITALADLRNKAAHNQGGFTKEDVEDMIRNVRRFMEDCFS